MRHCCEQGRHPLERGRKPLTCALLLTHTQPISHRCSFLISLIYLAIRPILWLQAKFGKKWNDSWLHNLFIYITEGTKSQRLAKSRKLKTTTRSFSKMNLYWFPKQQLWHSHHQQSQTHLLSLFWDHKTWPHGSCLISNYCKNEWAPLMRQNPKAYTKTSFDRCTPCLILLMYCCKYKISPCKNCESCAKSSC